MNGRSIGTVAYRILASQNFRIAILVFIGLQALYIAITYAYPMLYDEDYHFEITREFTHHIFPWISNQPQILDNFGALERTPQLMYHYLMSFPLRLITLFTDNLAVSVISLRVINIVLFLTGLVLSARLLSMYHISRVVQNTAIAFVGLLPVSVFLAATINYDNLLFPVTIYTLIVATRIIKNRQIDSVDYLKFTCVILFGIFVKTSYLPIAAIAVLFVVWQLLRTHSRHSKLLVSRFLNDLKNSPKRLVYALAVITVLLSMYGINRYGGNILIYRDISPSCSVQLEPSRCGNSILERRDNAFREIKNGVPNQFPQYMVDWYGIMQRDALSVNTKRVISTPQAVAPLPVLYIFFMLSLLIIVFGLASNMKVYVQNKAVNLFLAGFLLYLFALIYTTTSAYYDTYIPLAIQARYLLIFMVIIVGLGVQGISNLIGKRKGSSAIIVLFTLLFFIWSGGGAVTYISRSTEAWYWNNGIIRGTTTRVKNILQPVIKEGWYDD